MKSALRRVAGKRFFTGKSNGNSAVGPVRHIRFRAEHNVVQRQRPLSLRVARHVQPGRQKLDLIVPAFHVFGHRLCVAVVVNAFFEVIDAQSRAERVDVVVARAYKPCIAEPEALLIQAGRRNVILRNAAVVHLGHRIVQIE